MLFCKEIPINDKSSYLQGFSPDLGYVSFIKKKRTSGRISSGPKLGNTYHHQISAQNILLPFQLVEVLYQPSGQAYKILESTPIFQYEALYHSIEAQSCLAILIQLARDICLDHEVWEESYALLCHVFYKAHQLYTENSQRTSEGMLSLLALAELRFLAIGGYLHSAQDEYVQDTIYESASLRFISDVKSCSYGKLCSSVLSYKTSRLFLQLASRYFRNLMDKDYNEFSYLSQLFYLQDLSQNFFEERKKKMEKRQAEN